ncbi:MAG: response regulator [Gammaproteobacteria bacterium]
MKKHKTYLAPNEVAELLMVSPVTVRQWAAKGLLPAHTTAGGHRRFLREEVERFARERGMSSALAARGEGYRILVVDDDALFLGYLGELLSGEPDFIVETSHDGFDAGLKIPQFLPHLVLLDLMMNGLDGFAVCERIKSEPRTKHIRVVAMTGVPTPQSRARILAAGAEVCLAKPIDTDALIAVIRNEAQARA